VGSVGLPATHIVIHSLQFQISPHSNQDDHAETTGCVHKMRNFKTNLSPKQPKYFIELHCTLLYHVTPSNARQFYSSRVYHFTRMLARNGLKATFSIFMAKQNECGATCCHQL
jgi:hypothetical protein